MGDAELVQEALLQRAQMLQRDDRHGRHFSNMTETRRFADDSQGTRS